MRPCPEAAAAARAHSSGFLHLEPLHPVEPLAVRLGDRRRLLAVVADHRVGRDLLRRRRLGSRRASSRSRAGRASPSRSRATAPSSAARTSRASPTSSRCAGTPPRRRRRPRPARVRASTRASQPRFWPASSTTSCVHSTTGNTPSIEPSSVQPSTRTNSRPWIVEREPLLAHHLRERRRDRRRARDHLDRVVRAEERRATGRAPSRPPPRARRSRPVPRSSPARSLPCPSPRPLR